MIEYVLGVPATGKPLHLSSKLFAFFFLVAGAQSLFVYFHVSNYFRKFPHPMVVKVIPSGEEILHSGLLQVLVVLHRIFWKQKEPHTALTEFIQ